LISMGEKRMLKQIDHIGIVVSSLDQALERYERLFEVKATHIEVMEQLSLRVAFLPVGGAMLELIEPLTTGKGRLGELLEKRGEGIDHIAYQVDNLGEVLSKMGKSGVRLWDKKPRCGAKATQVAFISPEETNNVLIELVGRTSK
jgi:methylmalonyl-CoA/ethylmalonyl-CoA epimerase